MKFITFITLTLATFLQAQIVYEPATTPTKEKHIVFIASDHEYRAEETCPALARILSQHHGFKTTVLFGVDKDGHIKPGSSNIPGLETLKEADAVVMFTRFLDLPDEQMQHIDDYLQTGKPIVGLRTSSHAFKIPKDKKFSHYSFKSTDPKFKNGFGEQILGNTWEGHYGKNHKQGTRIQLIPSQKENPILRGVGDNANTQPLVSMEKDADPDPEKPPVACAWTRHYTTPEGKKGRVFHSTQGASEDILDDDYRRLVINGIFWAAGFENEIKADANISFVGKYQPTTFTTRNYVKNVKPSALADPNSPILPKSEETKSE